VYIELIRRYQQLLTVKATRGSYVLRKPSRSAHATRFSVSFQSVCILHQK